MCMQKIAIEKIELAKLCQHHVTRLSGNTVNKASNRADSFAGLDLKLVVLICSQSEVTELLFKKP